MFLFFPMSKLTLETVTKNFVNYSKYRIFPYFYTRFLFSFFLSVAATRSNIILVSFFPYVEKELTLATKLLLEISKFQLFKSEYRIFHYSYLLHKCVRVFHKLTSSPFLRFVRGSLKGINARTRQQNFVNYSKYRIFLSIHEPILPSFLRFFDSMAATCNDVILISFFPNIEMN